MKKHLKFIIFLFVTIIYSSQIFADSFYLTSVDLEKHKEYESKLNPEQHDLISKKYPDFKIVSLCSGKFSGSSKNELVLGIWKTLDENQVDWWKKHLHRIGIIWNENKWFIHVIDDEIEKDSHLSSSFPMHWQYTLDESGFSAEIKCGIKKGFAKNSFFKIRNQKKNQIKPVCFSTSNANNNWDCIVYDTIKNRFRLWFQSAYSD